MYSELSFLQLVKTFLTSYFCFSTGRSKIVTSSFQTGVLFNSRKPIRSRNVYFSLKSPPTRHVVDFPRKNEGVSVEHDHHEYFMDLAIQQAYEAAAKQEVPIGAILVRSNHPSNDTSTSTSFEILSASHNQVENDIDAIAHAEILCLRYAAKNEANWRLVNTTLYTTLEPCITCMAAAYAFRIDRIVYGAQDFRLGAVSSWVHYDEVMPEHPYHPKGRITVIGGIRKEECGRLLQDFFRKRRTEEKNRHKQHSTSSSIMGELRNDFLLNRQPNRQRMKIIVWFTKIKIKIQTWIQPTVR